MPEGGKDLKPVGRESVGGPAWIAGIHSGTHLAIFPFSKDEIRHLLATGFILLRQGFSGKKIFKPPPSPEAFDSRGLRCHQLPRASLYRVSQDPFQIGKHAQNGLPIPLRGLFRYKTKGF